MVHDVICIHFILYAYLLIGFFDNFFSARSYCGQKRQPGTSNQRILHKACTGIF